MISKPKKKKKMKIQIYAKTHEADNNSYLIQFMYSLCLINKVCETRDAMQLILSSNFWLHVFGVRVKCE